MRTSLLLTILVLVGCSKNMSPNDAVLAQPAYERSADEIPGESPDTVRQLEALIERDLYAMGLPPSRELSLSYTSTGNNTGNSAGSGATPSSVAVPKEPIAENKDVTDANAPPGPDASKIETNNPPKATAPVASKEEKSKKGEKRDKYVEDSCQKTCALIDNICDAAERICQITDKLPKDNGAPERCTRARNACTRAQNQGASCPCSS